MHRNFKMNPAQRIKICFRGWMVKKTALAASCSDDCQLFQVECLFCFNLVNLSILLMHGKKQWKAF